MHQRPSLPHPRQWPAIANDLRLRFCAICLGTVCLTLALTSITASPSHAHWADLSTAEIAVRPSDVQVTVTLPTQWVAFADQNRDQRLSPSEIQHSRAELQEFLSDRLPFTNRRQSADAIALIVPSTLSLPTPSTRSALPTTPTLPDPPTDNIHSTLTLNYQWDQPIDDLIITYHLFAEGTGSGHSSTAQALATIVQYGTDPGSRHVVFTPNSPSITLASSPPWRQVLDFGSLGMLHILTGYDHILFLISLLVAGSSLRELWKIVTAFTVAHSITLALAVLHIVTLPSIWVERAIALSLIYIAAENLLRRNIQHRWPITFGFGLVHGLGFAGILQDLNPSTSNIVLTLASFNLGVEVGQLLIISILFVGLQWLHRQQWQLKARYWVSWGVGVMGCLLLAQRFSWS